VPDCTDGVGVLPDLDPNGGPVQDRGALVPQEMVEELGLNAQAGRRIVGTPFLAAMGVEPFLR